MKFSSMIVLAEAVAAARLTEYRREAHAKRVVSRKGHPRVAVEAVSSASQVEYSENWAGSVIISEDISSVTARITVPSVSGTEGSCASAWVGIDGDTCDTAILQTGVDFCFENGQSTFDAWYEWYPGRSSTRGYLSLFLLTVRPCADYAYDFDLTFSEGDVVSMTVTATSTTAGTAVIENETTGESATQTFNGNVQGDLCRTNAEWIVEDVSIRLPYDENIYTLKVLTLGIPSSSKTAPSWRLLTLAPLSLPMLPPQQVDKL